MPNWILILLLGRWIRDHQMISAPVEMLLQKFIGCACPRASIGTLNTSDMNLWNLGVYKIVFKATSTATYFQLFCTTDFRAAIVTLAEKLSQALDTEQMSAIGLHFVVRKVLAEQALENHPPCLVGGNLAVSHECTWPSNTIATTLPLWSPLTWRLSFSHVFASIQYSTATAWYY